MNWQYIVGIGAGFVAIATPIAHLLIKSWFNKAKELEQLKSKNTLDLLDSFRRDIDGIGKMGRDLRIRVSILEKTDKCD